MANKPKPPRNLAEPEERLERIADREGERLDAFLARVFPWKSRTKFRELIDAGRATVNGVAAKATRKVQVNDVVICGVNPVGVPDYETMLPPILHQDGALLILNKPAGLAAHPVSGHAYRNLLSILHHHFKDDPWLPQTPHRLDENTTGVILAARSLAAFNHVRTQFASHRVGKIYLAMAAGTEPAFTETVVDAPIGTLAASGERSQAVITPDGKPARSRVRVAAARDGRVLFLVRPFTGRQHQVRIHLAHLGYPLLGDKRYRGDLENGFFTRPALHAFKLRVLHPLTAGELTVTAPLPDDMMRGLETVGLTPAILDQMAERLLAEPDAAPLMVESAVGEETDD